MVTFINVHRIDLILLLLSLFFLSLCSLLTGNPLFCLSDYLMLSEPHNSITLQNLALKDGGKILIY